MAQKTKPNALRLGLNFPWQSRWFYRRGLRFFLEEDHLIRELTEERILQAGIASIEVERTGDVVKVIIRASRPGLIIGRGGKGIEDLKNLLLREIKKLRGQNNIKSTFSLNVSVEELKRTEVSAQVLAQQMAFDIEKRQPFRKVIKRQLEAIMQNREVKGVKIKMSGRLNGAEISRSEWLAKGKMPLQNLRANIDYAEATAFNTYGTVGIKVWIYKGEIFQKDRANASEHSFK